MEIFTGAQKDWDTQKWFFLIYDANGEIEFESKPEFAEADDAETAAAEWVRRNKFK